MAFLETLKLCFDNNLIMGYAPDKLGLDKIAQKLEKDPIIMGAGNLESFGLFDSNTANYNTYYPDVTAEDLTPKDEDYIQPVFRALSEVIVHKEYNPVDFGMNGVLKKSLGLLNGATVNVDHEMSIGNAVGAVKEVFWQNSYKTDKGILIPAGINSKLKIDGKSNPKLARNIMMDPPAVHSTSVTVQFLWDKSHSNLTENEFWSKLGSFDKDGKMIRRIASDIKRYHEISLVSHGADPYAQLIKDAQIVNPTWGNISYNSVTGPQKQKQNYFFFDYKTDIVKNTIPAETNNNNPTHTQTDTMNKTFLLALAAVMGIKLLNLEEPDAADEQLIQDSVAAAVNNANTLSQGLATANTELERLRAIETLYNAEKTTFADAVSLKAFQDKQTIALRDKLKSTYKLLQGGTVKEGDAIAALIETASFETLSALNSQYTIQLEEKFPMACKKCGSKEVNRASVAKPEGEEEDATAPSNFRENLRNKAKNHNKSIRMFDSESAK